jgi:hypothetical protein
MSSVGKALNIQNSLPFLSKRLRTLCTRFFHEPTFILINFRPQSGHVDRTIEDYNNARRNNIPLWLDGDYAMRYAGIDRRLRNVEGMTPQPNLSTANSHVAIILPTAFTQRGVQRVHPSPECQQRMQADGTTVSAYGLNGQITPVDIMGATISAINATMINRDGFLEHWYFTDANGPFTLCAVIDLLSRSNLSQFIGKRFEWQEPPIIL